MDELLTTRDQEVVATELRSVIPYWHEIGIRLGLSVATMQRMDRECHSIEDKLAAVIKEWLQMGGTWQTMVDVLRSCGHSVLAAKLESQYSSSTEDPVVVSGEKVAVFVWNCVECVCCVLGEGRPRLSQLVPIPLSQNQCRQLALLLKIPVSIATYMHCCM